MIEVSGAVSPWLRYLIAFVVFCHGFVYVRVGSVLPGPIREWRGESWLLGNAVIGGRLQTLVIVLHVAAGIATLACALTIAFAPSWPGWWRLFATAGATAGILAFAVFWDGQTRLLFEEGGIGAIVSLILLLGALAYPRAFS